MFQKNLPITYLNWVLLWVNAIRDSYLWIDSPDCFFFKVDHIQWNHDLNSSLRKANWEHKILATISDVNNVIWNRNDKVENTLKEMVKKDFVKQIFVSSMPMNQLVWVDYNSLISNVQKSSDKPIFNIPSRSMTSSWIDWYSDLLFSLAKNINIDWWKKIKNSVAIVWNLFDRNEGDCIWNIDELKNIFEWLGLNVVSIWLQGSSFKDLEKIKNAANIISLPYGRKAASKIAKRLDLPLLELDLPLWFDCIVKFIKDIWDFFKISENIITAFIDKEFKDNDIWIIKWWINRTLFNKKVWIFVDPYCINWLIDISKTFWLDIKKIYIHWSVELLKNNKNSLYKDFIVEELPTKKITNLDIFISNRSVRIDKLIWEDKILEFWFPSYYKHYFTKQPYYGIKWTMNFLNRIYNLLSRN